MFMVLQAMGVSQFSYQAFDGDTGVGRKVVSPNSLQTTKNWAVVLLSISSLRSLETPINWLSEANSGFVSAESVTIFIVFTFVGRQRTGAIASLAKVMRSLQIHWEIKSYRCYILS